MTELPPHPHMGSCNRWGRARRWVAAFATQLWVAAGFTGMAFTSIFATAPAYTKVWPPLFLLVAILSLGTIFRPASARIGAACGTLLTMVGVARVIAVADYAMPLTENPHAVLHLLLWGLHIVVGLRWPQIVHDASLRHVLDEARDHPQEPTIIRGR